MDKIRPLVEARVGTLATMSVDNSAEGTSEDRAAASELLEHVSPILDGEILAFHTAQPTRGAVVVSREGAFDTVTVSFAEHIPSLDLLRETWRVVGVEATAVLVGEELEVDEGEIGALLESGDLPATLDLCEAAIVKLASRSGEQPADAWLEHGGRWIVGRAAC